MKKILSLSLLLLVIVSKSQTVTDLSLNFLNKMLRSQFDSCEAFFDESIKDKLNSGMIQNVWEQLPMYVGDYKGYDEIWTEKKDTVDRVYIRCSFEKAKFDLKFGYNARKKIIGIFLETPKSKATYNPPDYFEPSKFYETKLAVKTGTLEMPGVLCVPNNIENPPVVILLAGSGPNDKDETAGPNKPLKDIAIGLAAQGIASLRYDKRTNVYGKTMDMNKTGLNEEVFEDALSAIKTLKTHPLTKMSKVFVAGHSLGATCAPYIASKSKDLSGIILLAGSSRQLEDVVEEQIIYLSQNSPDKEGSKKLVEEFKLQAAIVRDPKKLKNAKAEELPLGATSFYWQSIKKYDHIKTAKKVKQPILILQGERDYQVTMKDFEIWKNELGADSKNKFISYPKLNHLFQTGENKSKPEEYQEQVNVDIKVVRDIVDFIKNIK